MALSFPKTLRLEIVHKKTQRVCISESLGPFDLSLLFHRQKIAIWNFCDFEMQRFALSEFHSATFFSAEIAMKVCDCEFSICKRSVERLRLHFIGTLGFGLLVRSNGAVQAPLFADINKSAHFFGSEAWCTTPSSTKTFLNRGKR